ncbi:MAG TPA: hypothetical protein VNQ79_04185 [Blastocatellia bacterium]|nr:hypothetical protein [Blastocatellia bacterium]
MSAVNPEFRDLQQQVSDLRDRLAKAEGEIQQLNRTTSDNTRQTIWQFVIFTVTMATTLLGALVWQTSTLERNLNNRLEQSEKRLEQRIDQMEKRFEDLKQVVLTEKK